MTNSSGLTARYQPSWLSGERQREVERRRQTTLTAWERSFSCWSTLVYAFGDPVSLSTEQIDSEGRLFLRAEKTDVPVRMPSPPRVLAELRQLEPINGTLYFWTGEGKVDTAADNYRRTLRVLAKAAGIENAHPHRFRDTAAVNLLRAGVPLERVQKVLGHRSIRITEKHYAPWVQSLQDQMEEDLIAVWKAREKKLKGY